MYMARAANMRLKGVEQPLRRGYLDSAPLRGGQRTPENARTPARNPETARKISVNFGLATAEKGPCNAFLWAFPGSYSLRQVALGLEELNRLNRRDVQYLGNGHQVPHGSRTRASPLPALPCLSETPPALGPRPTLWTAECPPVFRAKGPHRSGRRGRAHPLSCIMAGFSQGIFRLCGL